MVNVLVLYEITHGHLARSETRSSYVSEAGGARALMLLAVASGELDTLGSCELASIVVS